MNGVVLDVDTCLEDQEGNDLMEHRTTLVTIEDSEGNIFDIDMGGIIPEGDGRVPLLISHDESCFGAGEYENKVTILLIPISLFPLAGVARKWQGQKNMQGQDHGTQVASLGLRRGVRKWGYLQEARPASSIAHSFEGARRLV